MTESRYADSKGVKWAYPDDACLEKSVHTPCQLSEYVSKGPERAMNAHTAVVEESQDNCREEEPEATNDGNEDVGRGGRQAVHDTATEIVREVAVHPCQRPSNTRSRRQERRHRPSKSLPNRLRRRPRETVSWNRMFAKRTPSRRRWYRTREACIPPRSVQRQQLRPFVETTGLTENKVSDRGEEETNSSYLVTIMRADRLSRRKGDVRWRRQKCNRSESSLARTQARSQTRSYRP